ncbi:McrC family protein [Tahibacter caeni]|uniref:McrC family protein n=1 Tax=Tahibacter caeni TaxID=1453545 RepID=UPI002147F611
MPLTDVTIRKAKPTGKVQRLFDYVAKHLARQIAHPFTIKAQARSFALVTHYGQDWFRLKPDLLVQASGANRLMLDTKWKLLDGRKPPVRTNTGCRSARFLLTARL